MESDARDREEVQRRRGDWYLPHILFCFSKPVDPPEVRFGGDDAATLAAAYVPFEDEAVVVVPGRGWKYPRDVDARVAFLGREARARAERYLAQVQP